jgi:hypothetical protein
MSDFWHIRFVHQSIRVGTLEVVVVDVCFAWTYGCNKSLDSNWRLVGFDNKWCLSWGDYELLFLKRKNWWQVQDLQLFVWLVFWKCMSLIIVMRRGNCYELDEVGEYRVLLKCY